MTKYVFIFMVFCLNFTASAFNTNVFDTAIDKSGFTPMCNNQAIADKDCRVDDYLEGRYVVTSTVNLGAKCAFVIAEVIDSQTNQLFSTSTGDCEDSPLDTYYRLSRINKKVWLDAYNQGKHIDHVEVIFQ
ncbi:hypothetical protein J0A78_13070 [Providencia rettgeri]|uniref:hypothetical protein n=1 Tax=Providencia rettgeri TaxID=587 RepID=UPI0019D4B023|nr:hypothetical protein [Providencia rettgeri]MBN7843093.1 hypothetical protein [Providencia rettgeri]MBN7854087.1 hypothetical protein [Providencia rettgeri]MBN7861601.1 hypothetical protein [Providencia rettgeri]MBN7874177.1 hypothetical protein [Providencia rettgeri]MBN7898375.1 hypothetical protein [Providencia rettgeri]